jgi:ubiquitin-protein ligase E3 D
LHIWVFAPYLAVSFSAAGTPVSKPIQASKIFYREISADECANILANTSMSVEEVVLPAETVTQLAETLRESTARIPQSARKFKEWEVGFLERFAEEADQG